MYIIYNSIAYPCHCKPSAQMIYRGLPNNFPAPVKGEIALYADDDFLMRIDIAEDYLRQTFADGVLTLTNTPEPEPIEPIEPGPTELEQLRADVDYIAMETGVEL